MEKHIKAINNLAKFCGKRDIDSLRRSHLMAQYGFEQVDILVLFGGSILHGGDVLAEAMENNIAKKYIIVGGYGHTSATLFDNMEKNFPNSTKDIHSEAELFAKYLEIRYQKSVDFLETSSTNCGNNVTNLLSLITENQLEMKSILLIQDATMQLRMDATLRKYLSRKIPIINYPAYEVELMNSQEQLVYNLTIPSMWEISRYVSLLMGEIPRLMDTKTGYGPKGKNFLTHVEVPKEIIKSYEQLREEYPDATRVANPDFA